MTPNQTSEAGELLPCPLCGEQGAISSTIDSHSVECINAYCGARGPFAETVEFATAQWNNRATESHLRAQLAEAEKERDEAKARAIQAWKDADAATAKEVESRIAAIMGSPDNEIARITASRNVFRDQRDELEAERNNLREQLAVARSRGDDKEIAEKERDAAQARVGEMEGLLREAATSIRLTSQTMTALRDLGNVRRKELYAFEEELYPIADRIDAALATSPHRLAGRGE